MSETAMSSVTGAVVGAVLNKHGRHKSALVRVFVRVWHSNRRRWFILFMNENGIIGSKTVVGLLGPEFFLF